jgi:hypothetical protein
MQPEGQVATLHQLSGASCWVLVTYEQSNFQHQTISLTGAGQNADVQKRVCIRSELLHAQRILIFSPMLGIPHFCGLLKHAPLLLCWRAKHHHQVVHDATWDLRRRHLQVPVDRVG